jgi:hypothetical protein
MAKTATAVRVDEAAGTIYATVDGHEITVGRATNARRAWVIAEGRHVVWNERDGKYGYEGEGEGLHLYNVTSEKSIQVMQEDYMIDDVAWHRLSDGRLALIVGMSDGGKGASHVAVVDTSRGEVFRADDCSVDGVAGDKLTLALHGDDSDVEKRTGTRVEDLVHLFAGPVIRLKPDWG